MQSEFCSYHICHKTGRAHLHQGQKPDNPEKHGATGSRVYKHKRSLMHRNEMKKNTILHANVMISDRKRGIYKYLQVSGGAEPGLM